MCTSKGPKTPKPVPPPQMAQYAQRRKNVAVPRVGANPMVFTSPLGVTTLATTDQKTILGR